MKIHHLNCATQCPVAARWSTGEPGLGRGRLVSHVLLVETEDGLVLVDSGFGTRDIAARRSLNLLFRLLVAPKLDPSETALAQVQRLGFDARDVRHIVVTHLDLDHAGGLADFPHAKVHVHARELDRALTPRTASDRARYIAAQWAHHPQWEPYSEEGDRWFNFTAVRPLRGLRADVALVPLFGHTHGHAGVAVSTGDGWLLHAGDAYLHRGEVAERPTCPLGLRAFVRLDATDDAARRRNVVQLRDCPRSSGGKVQVFCAHDPVELAALSGQAAQRQQRTPPALREEMAPQP